MAEPVKKLRDVADPVVHPVETTKDLAAGAERGRTARTPLLAITAVTLFVGAVVLIVLAVALALYFIYGGR